jgi:hypothetical protein
MNFRFWRHKRDEELDEEIQSHLRMSEREHIARGEAPQQARDSARREMGNIVRVKETTREIWGWRWLENLIQDVRYALRTYRRTPLFAVTVVATIALGLGINTALFTIFDAYYLQTVNVREPRALYECSWTDEAGAGHDFAWDEYRQFVAQNPTEKSHVHRFAEL